MKTRNIYIGIALSLLCASCNKEEVSFSPELSGQAIEFGRPAISVETKGGPVNELPDGSSFGVLGYCLAQVAPDNTDLNKSSGNLPWEQKKNLSRPHLFYNIPIQYKDGRCKYDDPVKWEVPVDYLYSFFAYYPYNYCFTLKTDEYSLGAPSIEFSMPFGAGTVDSELDANLVPDAMIADSELSSIDVPKPNNGEVKLNFRHILTGLNFRVNNYNETHPVEIVYLKLSGDFFKSIDIVFGERTSYNNTDKYSGTYHLLKNTDTPISVPPLSVETETGGENQNSKVIGSTLLLVPSGGSGLYLGDNLTLTIGYKFQYNGSTEVKEKEFGRPDNFLPEAGTVYSAQLNFIGNTFVLEFIVDNEYRWEDGSDSDVTFG